MKLHFPDGKGGVNTIEVSDNISLYIENLLEDWTLETASESVKGGIKVGSGLYMDGDSLNAKQYTLFPATRDSLGGIMVGDGLSITADGELSVIFPSLPTASTTTKGGVKVGNGLYMTGDSLNANSLPVATTESLGGVIIGDGLTIESGVVSAKIPSLSAATYESIEGASLGGVMIGEGLSISRYGVLSADIPDISIATTDKLGVVKVGDGLSITESGRLSANIPVLSAATYESVTGSSLGGVMVGEGITVNRRGVISVNFPDLPTASTSVKGGIKVGDGLYINGDSLNATQYTLPTANDTLKGGVKIVEGSGLAMEGDFLTVTLQPVNNYNYTVDGSGEGLVTLQPVLVESNYSLPTANKTRLGGIKVGNGLEINSVSGVLSATGYTLYPATKGTLGGIIVGKGLDVDDYGVLDVTLPTASTTKKGAIIVGEGLEMIGDTLNVTVEPETNNYYTIEGGGEGIVTLLPVVVENNYSLPAATRTSRGGIRVGDGLAMDGDILNVTIEPETNNYYTVEGGGESYTLPTASTVTKGGIKVGKGLYMNGDSLNASSSGGSSSTYTLPTASTTTKGGIKVGGGLKMIGEHLSVDREELPIATRDSLGCVIVGQGLEITEDGVLSCSLEAVSPADVETIVEGKITGATSEWHGIATQIIDVTSDTEINNLIAQIDGVTKYLLCYRLNNGDGACVLPEDFMDIAFSVRGDNNKFVSSSGALYDESTAGMDTIPNLSVTKTRQNGYCTIPISTAVFNMAFTQGKFIVEWGTESEMGNVVFKGTVTALPNNPKHGWLCFVLYPTTRFYLYDGTAKQWRWWNVQGY